MPKNCVLLHGEAHYMGQVQSTQQRPAMPAAVQCTCDCARMKVALHWARLLPGWVTVC